MMLPDVNLLLNAHRPDNDAQHHIAHKTLQELHASRSAFALCSFVCTGFIRIVTNHRVFAHPTPLVEALTFLDYLLGLPQCRLIEPGDEHWSLFKKLLKENRITGPAISDAYLAAIAIEHGCELITFDSDFKRFAQLKILKL